MSVRNPHLIATKIVKDAGGNLVGRTRLQKVAYLMQLAGLLDDLGFDYRHFGPFSEDLAQGVQIAAALGFVHEEEKRASWGGKYSVYSTLASGDDKTDPSRATFVQRASKIGAIELELAATAAFLYAVEGIGRVKDGDPWEETAKRKPEKARDGRLGRARIAYRELRATGGPAHNLPAL